MKSWGFEDDDGEEIQVSRKFSVPDDSKAEPSSQAADDADVVAVGVDDQGAIVSVTLWPQWKTRVDPRQLHTHVLKAANAAKTQAASEKRQSGEPGKTSNTAAAARSSSDPLSLADLRRLRQSALADVQKYERKLSESRDDKRLVTSRGGHVSMTVRARTVASIELDIEWLYNARTGEIEKELVDGFRQAREIAGQESQEREFHSKAIDEARQLLADPRAIFTRLGLLSTSTAKGE